MKRSAILLAALAALALSPCAAYTQMIDELDVYWAELTLTPEGGETAEDEEWEVAARP